MLLQRYYALHKTLLSHFEQGMDDIQSDSIQARLRILLKFALSVQFQSYKPQWLSLGHHDKAFLTLYRFRHTGQIQELANESNINQHNQVLIFPSFHQMHAA